MLWSCCSWEDCVLWTVCIYGLQVHSRYMCLSKAGSKVFCAEMVAIRVVHVIVCFCPCVCVSLGRWDGVQWQDKLVHAGIRERLQGGIGGRSWWHGGGGGGGMELPNSWYFIYANRNEEQKGKNPKTMQQNYLFKFRMNITQHFTWIVSPSVPLISVKYLKRSWCQRYGFDRYLRVEGIHCVMRCVTDGDGYWGKPVRTRSHIWCLIVFSQKEKIKAQAVNQKTFS